MKRNTFITLIFVLVTLPVGGCKMDSAQRIELLQQALVTAQSASDRAAETVVVLQEAIRGYEAILSDPNLSSELADKIVAELVKVQAKLDLVGPAKEKADIAIAQIQAKIDAILANPSADIDISDELGLVGSGVSAVGTAIGGDVGKWLIAIGSIIVTISTWLGSMGLLKGKKATTALAEVVAGVDRFKSIVDDQVGGRSEAIRKDLKVAFDSQSPGTRAIVATLRQPKRLT